MRVAIAKVGGLWRAYVERGGARAEVADGEEEDGMIQWMVDEDLAERDAFEEALEAECGRLVAYGCLSTDELDRGLRLGSVRARCN